MTVAVGPVDGDTRRDNDRRGVTIEVADDRSRVLLIDGEARWEFQYLRNALVPRPACDGRFGGVPPAHHPRRRPDLQARRCLRRIEPGARPDAPDPLNAYDLIVVGDVRAEDVSAEAWSRLEAFADERGGTLVLASGPTALAAWAAQGTARKLLPVIDPQPVALDAAKPDPERPALPPGSGLAPVDVSTSESFPMMRLEADPEASREAWRNLPHLPWVATGRAKPLASTLAVVADDTSTHAVIAAQPYGLGKVLWIGTDGTWRWRYRVGDKFHHRFWGQVVRWASGAKLAVGNRLVRFGPTRPRPPEGEPATIRAQFAATTPPAWTRNFWPPPASSGRGTTASRPATRLRSSPCVPAPTSRRRSRP